MKKILFLIGLFFAINSSIFGHTGYPDTLVCPICKGKVVFNLTMSMTTFGSYLDFQKQGAIGYYYEEMINACPKCYYSGYYNDFDTTYSVGYIDSVKTITEKYKGKKIDDVLECEIAAEIKMMKNYRNDEIANIFLIASYYLRSDSNEIERRKNMQRKTINYLSKGIKNNEYENGEIATINYLIAEMYRRSGDFEQAIIHYDIAIKDENKADWLKDVAEKQKQLAIKKDENNNI